MKESNDGNKAPKKSFLYYYGLVMLVLMLLNIFIFPSDGPDGAGQIRSVCR